MNSTSEEMKKAADQTPSILDIYFKEIGRFPLLSPEEEKLLARSMRAGDDHARERLIVSNLRLVAKIAQEYTDVGLSLMDLIQEGSVGLIQAVDRFDPERGFRLTTYAVWWIRRAILLAINTSSRTIRIPDYLFRALRRMSQMRALAEDGIVADKDIADAVGMSADRLRQIEAQVSEMVSLDRGVAIESDETLEEQMIDQTGLSPEQEALRLLFRDELESVLGTLPARQALAIRLHYGIEDGCPYNLAEVGRIMDISRERVRQLVKEGMDSVTSRWGRHALDFYRGLVKN
ncbi:sigma-70 family RNA polymerase sigma factor [Candidatus Bipolaricaulota bacterium]|jgi:RNA polymerase primary sigma factor|nr:sigma-70 family RNA polymerase sigma factor [Candidatus Bipolaricaulota bacterium]TFH11574.1 MAG: sigma-70 family RNA polymerase sigma factor [Candidatus Atribacteria bacterium]